MAFAVHLAVDDGFLADGTARSGCIFLAIRGDRHLVAGQSNHSISGPRPRASFDHGPIWSCISSAPDIWSRTTVPSRS
jgi:hypothetical protein